MKNMKHTFYMIVIAGLMISTSRIIGSTDPVKKNEHPSSSVQIVSSGGGGDWIQRKNFYDKGKKMYELLNKGANDIMVRCMSLEDMRHHIADTIIHPFDCEVGLGKEKMIDPLHQIINLVKKGEKNGGVDKQDDKKKTIIEEYSLYQNELTELAESIDIVVQINTALGNSSHILDELIEKVRSYTTQAWEALEAITTEPEDKKLKEHYYVIVMCQDNIEALHQYITKDFKAYYDDLASKAGSYTKKVYELIKQLKSRGLDIRRNVKELTQPVTAKATDEASQKKQAIEDGSDTHSPFLFRALVWLGGVIVYPITFVMHKSYQGLRAVVGLFSRGEEVPEIKADTIAVKEQKE
ncbi:MAG: hypothetical protein WBQ73_03145 [Candidatus Babeliales bacterium]